jgi:uncharacterized membrane protein (DUF4010 family)
LHNPFEVRPAIAFALMFVALTVVSKLIEQKLGSTGLLVFSGVVGVTDVSPYILSLLNPSEPATRALIMAILVALMSNTLAKSVYFVVLAPAARKEAFLKYGVWATLHIPLIVLQ